MLRFLVSRSQVSVGLQVFLLGMSLAMLAGLKNLSRSCGSQRFWPRPYKISLDFSNPVQTYSRKKPLNPTSSKNTRVLVIE